MCGRFSLLHCVLNAVVYCNKVFQVSAQGLYVNVETYGNGKPCLAIFSVIGRLIGDGKSIAEKTARRNIMKKSCSNSFISTASAFMLGLLLCIGMAATPVWAVHNIGLFELEGNTTTEGVDDWDTLHGGGGNANLFEFTGINPDRNGVDDVFTGGGSKDTRDTATGGVSSSVWLHKTVTDASPPKDDITNAYAAAYTCPAGYTFGVNGCDDGDLIIYFGLDRFKTDGTAQMGFWFFQNDVQKANGGVFSGIHKAGEVPSNPMNTGDILVLVEVAKGGTVPLIKVFEWVGSGGDGKHGGTLNTLFAPGSAECTGGSDDVCAVTNGGSATPSWPYLDDDGNTSFQAQAFFEGGVNITRLLGSTPCFSAFLAETRSSGAPLTETAQLKDFSGDGFPLCGVDATKACLADPVALQCEDGSSCTDNGDCVGVGFSESCADTNPRIDDDGATFVVQFNVGITADGFGALHDPVIREDITYVGTNVLADNPGNLEECFITAIGGTSVTPEYLPSGTYVELDDVGTFGGAAVPYIDAGDTLNIEVTCDTPRELANIVTVGVNVTDEVDSSRITEQAVMQSGVDTCGLAPAGSLIITKDCVETRLMAESGSGPLVVETIVEFTIENDGNELLQSVKVTDDQICSGPTDFCITSGDTLLPGDIKTFRAAYMPSAPTTGTITTCQGTDDVGEACDVDADCRSNGLPHEEAGVCLSTTDKYVASSAAFLDTAYLQGTGALSNDILGDNDNTNGGEGMDIISDTATCPLCPADEICQD